MNYTKPILSIAAAFAALTLTAAPVVPGEYTDPSNLKKALAVEKAFETPLDFQFPYISTYYVKPTITTEDKVEINYYVTDWDHSQVRLKDWSHRFDIHLKVITPDGRTIERTKSGVKAGDGRFAFKPFPKGEYKFAIWAVDLRKGTESHRVWQRFRVLEPADLVIPADKIYTVSDADLEKYGICNKGDLGRKVLVEVAEPAKGTKFHDIMKGYRDAAKKHAADNPSPARRGEPGYAVFIPARNGEAVTHSWRCSHIVYDPGYDTNKVEQASIKTAEGLTKLLADKAAEGFRKVVLKPGTYRISAFRTVFVPSNMTFDLNGAVLKQNAFTGSGSLIVGIEHAYDAHLVNGIVEGDYYEHDYANSPNGSEWPLGFSIGGDSMYCSVENVYVRDITGYGAVNGQGKKNGHHAAYSTGIRKYVAGALNVKDGTVDTSRTDVFTSDFTPVRPDLVKAVQVSRYLGYQGILTRQWTLLACWYDKDKKFVSGETLYQYRVTPIPEGAHYLRITQFNASLEAANKTPLTVIGFYIPVNCEIKKCTFDRCRCVGFAANAMKNFLFEGNYFTRSGEAAARCAFDAEDGWDQMQDTTFRNNVCRGNPVNNSLLTCAGHNFIFEGNDCNLHFWPRTHSPCVRDSVIGHGSFMCDSQSRSGYGRFERNVYKRGLSVHGSKGRPSFGWDYAFHDFDFTGPVSNSFTLSFGTTARLVNSKVKGRNVTVSKAVGCLFTDCPIVRLSGAKWVGNKIEGGRLQYPMGTNVFENCDFRNVSLHGFNSGNHTFRNCTLDACPLVGLTGGVRVLFENCKLTNMDIWNSWWVQNSYVTFKNCEIDVKGKNFCRFGAYGIGDILIEGCNVTTTNKSGVIFFEVSDWRASSGDKYPGSITVRNSVFGSGFDYAVGTRAGIKGKPTKKLTYKESGNKMRSKKSASVFGPLPGRDK